MKLLNRTLPLFLATILVAPMASAFDWRITLPDFLKPTPVPETTVEPTVVEPTVVEPTVVEPIFVEPSVQPAPEQKQTASTRIVRGAASKGPISGATVNVFLAGENGDPASPIPAATTTTDASGNFSVSLPNDDEMYLVRTSGGSFIDESDQRPLASRRKITLTQNQRFESIIRGGQTSVAVTPYTDAMVLRARSSSSLGGFPLVMQSLIEVSTAGFGFSIFTTLPADPVAPASDASSSQLQYSLLLGAAANLANVSSIKMGLPAPTYNVIRDVIRDMSDGVTDGAEFGQAIVNVDSGKMLPVLDFDQQLIRFRNNNYRHYAGVTLPAWDSAQDDLSVQFPLNMILTRESDAEISFGVTAIDHLGRIELSANGVALLTDEEGTGMLSGNQVGNATWDSFGGSLRVDFGAIGGKIQGASTFFITNEQNVQVENEETIFIDRVEIELIGDLASNPQKGNARLFFREENTDLGTGVTTLEQFEETAVITIYDADNTIAFDSPAGFEFMPALPARTDESTNREIGVDLMIFEDDGTGLAVYKNDPFSWSLPGDNSLRVDFASGEFANYFILTSDSDGVSNDYAAVDYFDGNRLVHTGKTIFSKDLNLSWVATQVPGSYKTNDLVRQDDGSVQEKTVTYHLYPDGTGAVAIDSVNAASGLGLTSFSQFRLCWDLTADGLLRRKRSFISSGSMQRGEFPTSAYCENLMNDQIAFSREDDLFDTTDDGGTKTVTQHFVNTCGNILTQTPGCDELQRTESFPARYEIEPMTAIPPIPVTDAVTTPFDSPISINVLANDLPGDLAIDSGSLKILRGPAEFDSAEFLAVTPDGTASVSAGQILFTPNAGNVSDRRVTFAYEVSDTSGNPSVPGRVFIDVGSPIPAPSFFASPDSLADVHNVGLSPCNDPISTVALSSSSGGDFVINSVSVLGAINGFILATEQTPLTQATSQLIDVEFNCASAEAAIRSGSISVSTTDLASGASDTVSIPVTHEVVPAQTVAATPSSLSDVHNVGISPCPDPIASVSIDSSNGENFIVNNVSVTGAISGFITASAQSLGVSSPLQQVDVAFNCASGTGTTRSGSITIDTTDPVTGLTSSTSVSVTHQVVP